jgi:acetylornithine/N-succinyldiaminopimelate aminotransferase
MTIKEKDKAYIMGAYARNDVVFVKGEESFLYDDGGKKYIDFGSGIGVNALGRSNAAWQEAVCAQTAKLNHVSGLYYTEPAVLLAEKLAERTHFKKFFFANSGAEANECALKAARKYAYLKGISNPEIIVLKNSFHGRTMMTLTATAQDSMHPACFAPYMEGFKQATANDLASVRSVTNSNTAAVFLEVIQGEGGVVELDPSFVAGVDKLCREKDILLIVDEVQTGNARTGKLYAYMHNGLLPDIATTAKGLGNGLPIGVCMFGEKVQNIFGAGEHGSTFGANPIVCAGALAVLNQLDDKLMAGVTEREHLVRKTLSKCKAVLSITGKGLMLGLQINSDPKAIVKQCLSRGLVILTAHEKLRIIPPLNIPTDVLVDGLKILTEVLNETLS